MEIYVVQQGDTVYQVSRQFDLPESDLIYVNQLTLPYTLVPGQALLIESNKENYVDKHIINGYAYPFIQSEVLKETLSYLSKLSVFSYGFTWEGQLILPQVNPDWMLYEAYQQQVPQILTLTPFGEDGKFNNMLIHHMVTSLEVKERLISELLDECVEKGYAGVDVDFEYILADDKDLFADFVSELVNQLNAIGLMGSVALAPKTSATQVGLLYEGKDYRRLGEAADFVLLMTYEWGYTYGPAQAVAPLNKVRQVVDYALTEIPNDKILLGIPNYGYDWTLPYEKGVSKARTIGNVEAVQIAANTGATIQFDEQSQCPFFTYELEGLQHEVWFSDVRSYEAKAKLVLEKELRGIAYWQIMRLYRAGYILFGKLL